MSQELCFLSIEDLAQAYRARRLSPVEVTRAVFAQLDRVNPLINAVVRTAPEQALEQARLAEERLAHGTADRLCGVPVTIKDLIATKDMATEYGCLLFKDHLPAEDAPAVARLKEAGAVIIGKTATSELGWLGATHSQAHGITRNPWDLSKNTSGSSGGSAAAVACGIGPLSVGSDGGASIRAPAAYCGVVGLQPSYGRVPRWPLGTAYDLVYEGPIARTVHDIAAGLDVLSRPDERDWQSLPPPCESFLEGIDEGVKGLRVAFSADLGFADVRPEVAELVELGARALEDAGARLIRADPPIDNPLDIYTPLWMPGRAKEIRDLGPERAARLDKGHRRQGELGQVVTAYDYMTAQEKRHEFCRRLLGFLGDYDVLVTPTLPDTAWEAGLDYPPGNPPDPPESIRRIALCFTFSLAHVPACSVPCGMTKAGLPVGMQIVGRRFGEAMVLRVARAFEQLRPWSQLRPPVCDGKNSGRWPKT